MLDDERTPSPAFEPPRPTEYMNTAKNMRSKKARNGKMVQSMINNDYNHKYAKTDSKLKQTIQSELKLSLSQAKEQFALKMRQDETGARWRGQGSVKPRRNRTTKKKRKLQTKSVIKTRRPKKAATARPVNKTVLIGG